MASAGLPVASPAGHPARWWHRLPDGRLQCDLCSRECQLHDGQRGVCCVRQSAGGQMLLTTYGRSSGFCLDPIENKPLSHFYPRLCSPLALQAALFPASSARAGTSPSRTTRTA